MVLIKDSIDVNDKEVEDKDLHLQNLNHFRMEIQAVNSKYLSANIPGDLNVDKNCCENLTTLNPMLQYITQMSPH